MCTSSTVDVATTIAATTTMAKPTTKCKCGTDPNGGLCPGKTQAGWAHCSAGWGGSERQLSMPFQIVCVPAGVSPPEENTTMPAPMVRDCARRHLNTISELLGWPATPVDGLEPPPPPPPSAPATIRPLPSNRPRVLHCHDMMGGYCHAADEGYLQTFAGWDDIDFVIYFSHNRISIPPQCWIDACHSRGIPILGTIITEGPQGLRENVTMLDNADLVAERLAALCEAYRFDGFLINIEAPIQPTAVPSCLELLQLLTICIKQTVGEHGLVIYYDSLDAATGQIRYQNALTPSNMPFFDACDGLFTNYWWNANTLKQSASLAGPRKYDVYAGIDCFARGPGHPSFIMPYTQGTGCEVGVGMVADAGLSLAVFAPGWSVECGEACGKEGEEAKACDARFWAKLAVGRVRRS